MGLFAEPQNQEDKNLDLHIQTIKNRNTGLFNTIKTLHEVIFNQIWNSEFSPQIIFDKFGTDSIKMFQISSMIQNMLKSIDPSYTPLVPPKEFTINSDGTVTIIEPETSSESE